MKKVILDTNFILTCIKQKIDFFEELFLKGFEVLIPKQVIDELKKITTSKQKLYFRENAKLALKLLEKNKTKFNRIDLRTKNVDSGIEKYSKGDSEIIVATLDKKLKNKVGKKIIIRGKKKLEVI